MKKLEKLDKIKNYIVHCPKNEDAIKLCKFLDEYNFKWREGTNYIGNTQWHVYKDQTCYNPYHGLFARYEYYNSEKGRADVGHIYEIISVDKFINTFLNNK